MFATKATQNFANRYPSLAISARNQLLKNPQIVYETDVISYIQSASEELRGRKDLAAPVMKNELNNLILMFHEKSAGLEFLVRDIVRVNSNDLRLKKSGIPFDISARTLFLTRSAFPSLFLSQNPRAGAISAGIRVQNDEDRARFFSKIERYSFLRTTTSREKIVHDIHAYLKMENLLFFPGENQRQ